ncbi:plasmid pRiA4b ORF-3 family protein [Nocardia grenadensis]|uniref:plasmid pRiA4b ORF-3 family protein n=1 Tax=Nocardia grenadensis TaxID=931537 RepID=UPI003D7500E3
MTDNDPAPDLDEISAAMPPAAVNRLFGELVADIAGQLGAPGPAAPRDVPSARRLRRSTPVTYRIRIDLLHAKPPAWRRVEVASDMFLDELHEVIQASFHWYDCHLHQFASSGDHFADDAELYLCPYQVEEGDPGVPEEQVRLDEVLVDAGDAMSYWYDFGDDWMHVLKLEAVLPRADDAPRARCTAGRQPSPAEDCGGIPGYELFTAACDPGHRRHQQALAEVREWYGEHFDLDSYAPVPFDLDEINAALAELGTGSRTGSAGADDAQAIPPALAEILRATGTVRGKRQLRALITDAALDRPATVDAGTAARAVRPYACLLDQIGPDGVALTSAGYLPPTTVAAVFTDLDLGERWIGKGNREDLTPPIANLRQAAQQVGLLRKYRGRLNLTAKARAIDGDPIQLWMFLAERVPAMLKGKARHDTGILYFLTLAAGDAESAVAEILDNMGWCHSDGSPVTAHSVIELLRDIRYVLEPTGLRSPDASLATEPFARAVLARLL